MKVVKAASSTKLVRDGARSTNGAGGLGDHVEVKSNNTTAAHNTATLLTTLDAIRGIPKQVLYALPMNSCASIRSNHKGGNICSVDGERLEAHEISLFLFSAASFGVSDTAGQHRISIDKGETMDDFMTKQQATAVQFLHLQLRPEGMYQPPGGALEQRCSHRPKTTFTFPLYPSYELFANGRVSRP